MKTPADLFSGIVLFVRCAELCSFSRAAADLGVTTAAVSKAVKRLEEDLGVSLLDRSSRTVKLTRSGEVFLERCRQAVLSVRGAREAMQASRREPQGEVNVTMPSILADFVVPKLPRLSTQYPRLSFRLNLSDRFARLADENIDVAIRLGELSDSTLVSRLLRRTSWVTIASPSYLAQWGTPKVPSDIARHNCLRFIGPNGRPRDFTFAGEGRTQSIATAGNLLIDNGGYLLAAAQAGMGLAQTFDYMVGDLVRAGNLVEVLASYSAPGPPIHALTTKGRSSSANVRAVMRFIVDAFRS